MKKISKKIISLLMTVLIALSAFPITSYAGEFITNMNSDAEFGVVSGSYDKYGHEMHYAKYDGKTYIVFCCEYGTTSPSGSTYKYGDDFKKYYNRSGATYEKIADYIAFGYTLQYGDGLPSNKNEWIAACCTQQFVWETLGVNPTRSSWDSEYMNDSLYKSWLSSTQDLIDTYYSKKPSFNSSTTKVNLGETTTLTDSNGVFKYYPTFTKTVNKVTFSHTKGKNTLSISVAEDCTTHDISFKSVSYNIYMDLPTGDKYDSNTMNYCYFEFDKGNIQDLMFSKRVDPRTFAVNVDVTFGNLEIHKTSEDEKISNITFTVKGNGKTYTMKTNTNGIATLSNIPIGTYTISEEDIVRYVKQATQNATVTDGGTAKVYFNNELKKGNIKIQKNCEDNLKSGLTFNVTGSDGSSYNTTTNSNGIAEINNIPVYDVNNNKITYTVKETNVPIKYVTPDNQTVTLEADKTSTVTFDNILKKFRVTVTKSDIEKGHAQGDASLAGAVYGLYKGETLMASYTTDSNASFTTDYFVCDTDWTIREISSSEGYLVNSKVYPVGADPRLYTVELNETSNAVTEQVIKGNFAIIKHTDDGSTQIETPEKSAEFQIYIKSAGSFVNADKDERDTIVCDEDGFASSKLMPYGVYTVHQTKGWDGREKIKDFDVFISSDGKTYKFLINNANFESYLKVVKLDKETGKQIAYEGAAFEIYDSDNHRISMQFTYPQVTTIHTFYTNSEGYLITPEKLSYGDYTLVEVQAPYGYVLESTPIPFTITQENSSTDTGVTVVKVKARDMAQKGVIEITKTGEVFATVNENEGIYTPVYETQNLANAVFEIYAAEDITTLDGTVRYYQGEKVDEIATGENGVAKSKELYLGKYTVIEKTAPNGYVNANEQYDVELTYAGQNVSVTNTDLSVYNERQRVTVSLKKALEENEIFNLGNNDEITSITFGLYAGETITASDKTYIPTDALITSASCDKDGNITFDCDLPIGYRFYVKEISTDEHYILDDTKYEFNTEYQGQTVSTIDIKINNNKDILNNLIYGSVKGFKYDRETNEPIGNALFGLFNADEIEFTEENAILTAESDKDGVFTFENIPYGNWIICELKAADGYLENTEIYHVQINSNEQIIEINIVNDRIPEIKTQASIDGEKEICATEVFTLTDTVEYKHLIPGKEYVLKGILMDKNTGKPLNIDGKEVTAETVFVPETPCGTATVEFTFDSKFIKKETSIVVFESLYKEGQELAVHTDIDDEDQTVTVKIPEIKTTAKADGKKKVTASKEITIEDTVTYTNLTVGKEYVIKGILMDKSTGKPFKVNGKEITSEVKFIPEKSNGTVTVTFTFDSSEIKKETDVVVFESLYRDGVEIATHADIKDEGQTITVEMPKVKTPKTGDKRNYGVWIGLGAIALGGAFSALILKIRTKKNEDDI